MFFELRQYRTKPGQREKWVKFMEEEIIPFQVSKGMVILGSFVEQTEDDLLWIRDEFLVYEQPFERFVVHGHTPVSAPDLRSNRINIDTGAFATGRLTCIVIEGSGIAQLAAQG